MPVLGRIAEEGTFTQLNATGEKFRHLMSTHMESLAKEHDKKDVASAAPSHDASQMDEKKAGPNAPAPTVANSPTKQDPKAEKAKRRGQLVQKEEMSTGNVSLKSYLDHFQAMGGAPWIIAMFIIFVLSQVFICERFVGFCQPFCG